MELAYICNECGEGFQPDPITNDWPELRRNHKTECSDATFRRTTVDEAF